MSHLTSPLTSLRGRFLCPDPIQKKWSLYSDARLTFNGSGQIESFHPNASQHTLPHRSVEKQGRSDQLWMPGFVDTHIHFPQTHIIGSASGPLIDWLDQSVFPEELKFQNPHYADRVAQTFCTQLAQNGTTCASIYSSSSTSATHRLFQTLNQYGLRGDVGLTLMDRHAPDRLCVDAVEALEGCTYLIEQWHQADQERLRFRMTPRFAISCTPALLKGAGDLVESYQIGTQTHISENQYECEWTQKLFPNAQGYLDVYRQFGLLNSSTLLAHCIWLTDEEWQVLQDDQVKVTHCPDSNFFLGSGQMPLYEVVERGITMGLGSDVGAGRTFSMRKACARAYDASRITQSNVDPQALLWWATRGGALALERDNQIGCLDVGYDADLIQINFPPFFEDHLSQLPSHQHIDQLCSMLMFHEDWNGVVETRVRGQVVWSKEVSD